MAGCRRQIPSDYRPLHEIRRVLTAAAMPVQSAADQGTAQVREILELAASLTGAIALRAQRHRPV
jgi:hypothetical protein